MLRELTIAPTYDSYENDLVRDFYNPLLSQCVVYDRVSGYFSAKALAMYAQGLEVFAKNHGHFRLIVSVEISHDDLKSIQEGYEKRKEIDLNLRSRLIEDLSLTQKKGIANLSYLISLGVVDIKIAFTASGILHEKYGYFSDSNGDTVYMMGSNNETSAAIESNLESYITIKSWENAVLVHTGCDRFNQLWRNQKQKTVVVNPSRIIMEELEKYNRGKLVTDIAYLDERCEILDLTNEENLFLVHQGCMEPLVSSVFKKLKLKRYIDYEDDYAFYFYSDLSYLDYIEINRLLEKDALLKKYKYHQTKHLYDFIENANLKVDIRKKIGLELKNENDKYLDKFNIFCSVIDQAMVRELRPAQKRDSFFLLMMRKAANFSVPGAGKTATVLGVYAYLHTRNDFNKMVIIGPKSCFGSWIDEFRLTFGNKENLNYFSVQDSILSSPSKKKKYINYDSGSCNMFLFNYESLPNYIKEIKSIVDDHTLLIYDEVHRVKKINGYFSSAALEVSKRAYYSIVLTGTPLPNSYIDLYNLLHILFPSEYKMLFENLSEKDLRYPSFRQIEEINMNLQPFFCRTTKKELGVPEPNEDIINNNYATAEETKLYHILQAKFSKCKFVFIIRILQMESNPHLLLNKLNPEEFKEILDVEVEDINDIDFVNYSVEIRSLIKSIDQTTKMKSVILLVENLVTQNKPVIIWTIFKDTIHKISEILTEKGITCISISGMDYSLKDRQDKMNAFKCGESQVLLTNPFVLAESVSLHGICHDAIYFEYSYNLVHLLQSKDRIHRLGLATNQYTQYYYMMMRYMQLNEAGIEDCVSLDEAIYNRLELKEQRMLGAIEQDTLEGMPTKEEDLQAIYNELCLV